MKNNEIVHLPRGVVLPTRDCRVRLRVSDKEEWLWRREDYSAIALIGVSFPSQTVGETIDQDGGREAERNRIWKITFEKTTQILTPPDPNVRILSDGSMISNRSKDKWKVHLRRKLRIKEVQTGQR